MMAAPDFSESTFAKLITIAGRQRMLSQRIGFLAVVLNNALVRDGGELPSVQLDMLKKAAAEFDKGYDILRNGDPDLDLPKWESTAVGNVLDAPGTAGGRMVIDRFQLETRSVTDALETGEPRSEAETAAFSEFVLTDVLTILQRIVTALETDFEAEMAARQQRRNSEIDRVAAAIREIQRASRFSRMIALNAKISANRAGPHGREFSALTDEIKKISGDITESSEDIIRYLEIA